jgi:hypothetical protein
MKAVLLIDGKKRCSKCGTPKAPSEFNKNGRSPCGLKSCCKECLKPISAARYPVYAANNVEKIKERRKVKYIKNKTKIDAASKQWKKDNPERARELSNSGSKQWRLNNPERARAIYTRHDKKVLGTPDGKLNRNMSRQINHCLHGLKGYRKWETLAGFTTEQLKKHLEKQFREGMTWENYGEWHVDHKTPRAVFNFTSAEDIDFKRCWSLKNLQPLWAKANLSKGDKLDGIFQPSLAIAVGG